MDDNQIIGLYHQRSEQAITETEQKYGSFLERVAYNILLDHTDSEEIVNDTYLGAWNSMPPQKPASLKHFLSRITRNLALDRFDRRTAQKRGGADTAAELNECIPDRLGNVEREVDSRELARMLDRFLVSLDRQSLAVFILRYYYSEPIADISKKLDIAERRVKYLLSKTRSALRQHLQTEGELL